MLNYKLDQMWARELASKERRKGEITDITSKLNKEIKLIAGDARGLEDLLTTKQAEHQA